MREHAFPFTNSDDIVGPERDPRASEASTKSRSRGRRMEEWCVNTLFRSRTATTPSGPSAIRVRAKRAPSQPERAPS